MSEQIKAIAQRLSMLREILEIRPADMAAELGITESEYLEYEEGKHDFAFSFLFGCANKLGVDIIDLLTGDTPKLTYFSLVKKNEGLAIDRRKEYKYQHLAFFFRDKKAEPFHVTVEPGDLEMHLNSHTGQEFNYILEGSMRIQVGEQEAVVTAGDAMYYDSSCPHGMVCEGDAPCRFLAIIMK